MNDVFVTMTGCCLLPMAGAGACVAMLLLLRSALISCWTYVGTVDANIITVCSVQENCFTATYAYLVQTPVEFELNTGFHYEYSLELVAPEERGLICRGIRLFANRGDGRIVSFAILEKEKQAIIKHLNNRPARNKRGSHGA